jgi:hypothetical protein
MPHQPKLAGNETPRRTWPAHGAPHGPRRYIPDMILTPAEEIAVRRAVTAYRAMRNKGTKGAFRGVTADQILEELHPTPVRWLALAAFVIARAEGKPASRG